MGHIPFKSSILISNEMMYKVTIMFDGYYFFGERYHCIISFFTASAFRVVNENMAPLYFLLLLLVVSHAFIGLYRPALKWGFEG